MTKKILIGIFAGVGIVLTIFNPVVMGILAIVIWIYVVVEIRKSKRIFEETTGHGFAETPLKKLKAIGITAVIFFFIAMIGIFAHNIISSQSGTEDTLFFIIGLAALYLFILVTVFGLGIFLKARQKTI